MSELTGAAAMPLESISPVTFDVIYSGSGGTNRARGAPCQIAADTDLGAILAWLDEFKDSPQTFRAYRREAERFFNWLVHARQTAFSSATREDLSAYEDFLANPQPAPMWITQSKARRNSPSWRPFNGPLQPASRAQAMSILGALFSFLVEVRYLSGNPLSARRRKRRSVPRQEVAQKSLSLKALQALVAALREEADALPFSEFKARAHVERMLFIVRFLANTGLRREEIGTVAMSDIFSEHNPTTGDDYWYLRVTGKGQKTRIIALNDSARDALGRYRRFYKTPEHYRGNTSMILLPLISDHNGSTKVVTGQSVYMAVMEAFKVAASMLQEAQPEMANTISHATPHWFRHTFATLCLSAGHPLKLVQEQLGHESIETTAIYQHASRFEMFEAFNNFSI